jgi:hypothetical protein
MTLALTAAEIDALAKKKQKSRLTIISRLSSGKRQMLKAYLLRKPRRFVLSAAPLGFAFEP